jgi:hypothetical protein
MKSRGGTTLHQPSVIIMWKHNKFKNANHFSVAHRPSPSCRSSPRGCLLRLFLCMLSVPCAVFARSPGSLVRSGKSRTNFRHLQATFTHPSEICRDPSRLVLRVAAVIIGNHRHHRRHGGGNSSPCVLCVCSGGGGQQQQGAGVWERRGRSCREQRQAPTAAAVASAALTSIAEQAGPAHAAAASWQAPPPELTLPQRARWDCPLSRNHSLFESRDISKHGLLGFGRLRVWFSGRV